ncbi:transcriptional regulator [Lysinibacillus antri]|uniref:Transcriptional regulator n=1 Tax=Lysinibacillus antri TaxID=2498145 RepID=A0A3S0WF92_9BACI|nr:transcriptional regulator [Lysinibacillus antri]RUL50339.1 transcriptional regulator [Lysinibacillus antri]
MTIHIAVICSSEFAQRVQTIESELSSIKLDYYLYNEPQQAANLVRELKPCDAVFFSGSIPYIYAKEICESLPIPSHYLHQDETAISTTLLSIMRRDELSTIQEVSMDLVEPQIIHNVLEDIGFVSIPKLLKIDPKMEMKEIIHFHHELYEQKKITRAITSVHAVYESLKQLNVPVVRMIDPKSSIIKGIIDTKNMALLAKSQSAKIAIGYIQLNGDTIDQSKELLLFSTLFKTRLIQVKNNQFIMYMTQGDVERVVNSLTNEEWKQLSAVPFKLAFGYGKSIEDATQNAKDALKFTKENSVNIITEKKQLKGPYPHQNKSIELRTKEPKLVEIAKRTALSPANLSKVLLFSRTHPAIEFTAYDLERFLQVSRRTTERILKKLVDHQYAKIVGEEMTYQQGRPRSLYKLNIPTFI